MNELETKARELVKERILGMRKGTTDSPNYEHSWRVGDTVRQYGFGDDVVIAAILHDVIEDGEVTAEELATLGFPSRVIDLVQLCSHDMGDYDGDERWVKMMANLVDAAEPEAWAIKIADVSDNIRTSSTMPPPRAHFLHTVKGPLVLSLSHRHLADAPIWSALKELVVK